MTLFILTFQNGRGTLLAMSAFDFLLQAQNVDGGWGYRVGGMSYVEPTAAVMLALHDSNQNIFTDAEKRARDYLLSIQHPDGGWGIAAMDAESGWMTAWAVRALISMQEQPDRVARGLNWLVTVEGLRVTDDANRTRINQAAKIDSTLRGWPWQMGDSPWVHPTSLAILALVAAGQPNHVRVQEGLQYLFDRAAPSGGWNIGNPWMLDKQIPATIQDTAIALLALRAVNQSASETHMAAAIQFLQNTIARAQTPAELAWGIYALKKWNVDVRDALERLNALQKVNGSWNDNPFITAIAAPSQK